MDIHREHSRHHETFVGIKQRLLDLRKLDVDGLNQVLGIRSRRSARAAARRGRTDNPEFSGDAEFLCALLWTKGRRADLMKECAQLIEAAGGLLQVLNASVWQIETISAERGLSVDPVATRRRLDSVAAVEERLALARMKGGPIHLNYQAVLKYLAGAFSNRRHEEIRLLYLDSQEAVTGAELAAKALCLRDEDGVKAILSQALKAGAQSFILGHHRPGEEFHPTNADLAHTRKIKSTAAMIGLNLFDHIIVTGSNWFSYRVAGLMEESNAADQISAPTAAN